MNVLTYSGGPFRVGQLSEELRAAGVVPVTIRGHGDSRVDIVLPDDAPAATVDAVVAAHRPEDPALDRPLTLRQAMALFQPRANPHGPGG